MPPAAVFGVSLIARYTGDQSPLAAGGQLSFKVLQLWLSSWQTALLLLAGQSISRQDGAPRSAGKLCLVRRRLSWPLPQKPTTPCFGSRRTNAASWPLPNGSNSLAESIATKVESFRPLNAAIFRGTPCNSRQGMNGFEVGPSILVCLHLMQRIDAKRPKWAEMMWLWMEC